MSLSQDKLRQAHIALNRFGLGGKPGTLLRIAPNAKAALLNELNTVGIADIPQGDLPTYNQACLSVHTTFTIEDGRKQKEMTARIVKQMAVPVGFVERLVLFFSNHFSMSVNKDGAVRATIGQLERDVIRKNVLGNFKDMLMGVMAHPAMIRYLDNDDSIGPHSVDGLSWGVGLNHNLAREILELHTLGVNGGYTEEDINALAAALTGWSFVRGWESDGHYNGGTATNRGHFIFRPKWHEPGPQVMLGRTYAQTGMTQAKAMLSRLALHPSTAQFIAFKLVKHFITDSPTPEMVNPVAAAFSSTKGNLKAVATALINLPEAWALPFTKIRTPYEMQIATMRAMHRRYLESDRWPYDSTLYALNNLPWEHITPDGYPDESDFWLSPDGMRIRLETSQMNAWEMLRLGTFEYSGAELADALFDAALSPGSRQAVAGAGRRSDALATLFMIPEFQRR